MSLIFGVNIQNGVYIAADTRLTRTLPSGLVVAEDDFSKFCSLGKFIHCVTAGNAAFVSFLLQKIKNHYPLDMSAIKFREEIKNYIQQEASLYPLIHKLPSAAFIFGGCSPDSKKIIDMHKIAKYTQLQQEKQRGAGRQRLDKRVVEGMVRAATSGGGRFIETELPLSMLFSVEVVAASEGVKVEVQSAEWGDFIMLGSQGMHTENVPETLMLDLDFTSRPANETGQDFFTSNMTRIMAFFLLEMVPRYQLHNVGGAVTAFWVTEHGALFPTGEFGIQDIKTGKRTRLVELSVQNDIVHAKINNALVPLREVINYYQADAEMEMSII